jgi:hypothetical protein
MGKKIDIAAVNAVVKTLRFTTFISLGRAGHTPRVPHSRLPARPS